MIRLYAAEFGEGRCELRGDAVQHARVRRIERGEAIELLDGNGRVGVGAVDAVTRSALEVIVDRVEARPQPTTLEVFVPVADRDRMLFAAEKCVELQVTAWQPVYFERSRSVSPRGEGSKFADKVRARMQAALEQSGGAWLPRIAEERELADAIAGASPAMCRLLLDVTGEPLARRLADARTDDLALMIGPEGGLSQPERAKAVQAGWLPSALTDSTLRFETAIVSAVAVARALRLDRRAS